MEALFVTSAALRAKAERLLRDGAVHNDVSSDPQQVIHELQLHQIELEMQNESLRDAYVALEHMAERYRNLYDLAPVAFLTVDMDCRVLDANRAATAFFATRREALIGTRISTFVAKEHAERFTLHRNHVLVSYSPSRCHLDMVIGDAPEARRHVHLESIRTSESPESWRIAVIAD